MKTIIVTVLACVWVVIFAVIGIYMFSAPRTWMERVLAVKGSAEAAVVTANVPTTANAPKIADTTFAATSSLSSASPISVPSAPVQRTTYQYRLISGVGPCLMNQLGADGWHPIQFGGTLVSMYGGDADCKKFGITDSLDWALFERATYPVVQN